MVHLKSGVSARAHAVLHTAGVYMQVCGIRATNEDNGFIIPAGHTVQPRKAWTPSWNTEQSCSYGYSQAKTFCQEWVWTIDNPYLCSEV